MRGDDLWFPLVLFGLLVTWEIAQVINKLDQIIRLLEATP